MDDHGSLLSMGSGASSGLRFAVFFAGIVAKIDDTALVKGFDRDTICCSRSISFSRWGDLGGIGHFQGIKDFSKMAWKELMSVLRE